MAHINESCSKSSINNNNNIIINNNNNNFGSSILFYSPATTSEVATKESMAAEYCGSVSDRKRDVSRHSIVATPSISAPYTTGTCRSAVQLSKAAE